MLKIAAKGMEWFANYIIITETLLCYSVHASKQGIFEKLYWNSITTNI